MKAMIYLFSCYMLALSLMPCGDGGGGIVEIASHLFGLEHQEHQDHEQHSNACSDDHCPPFCICNCCSTALDYPVKRLLQINVPSPAPSENPSFVPSPLAVLFIPPVWQPPQFC